MFEIQENLDEIAIEDIYSPAILHHWLHQIESSVSRLIWNRKVFVYSTKRHQPSVNKEVQNDIFAAQKSIPKI